MADTKKDKKDWSLASKVVADRHWPCPRCHKMPTKDRHDPCIPDLPGVVYACCGHGIGQAYVVFESGQVLRGLFDTLDGKVIKVSTEYEMATKRK